MRATDGSVAAPRRRPRLARAAAALVALAVAVQAPVPARADEPPPFTAAQLDQMLAPIALFPDALLSQVLMAATYPADVALAVEWAYAHRPLEGDAAVVAARDEPWDPSVQSLVAFPQALAMLGESPQWVQDLGDAFLGQPAEVMDSVQLLRSRAKDAGHLTSDEHMVVTVEAAPPPPQVIVVSAPPPPVQIVTLVPARPQVVFVPVFSPVWAFGPWWHPAFPPFFFPPPPRWGWGRPSIHVGFWWGRGVRVQASLWGGVDWGRRNVTINVNRWNTVHVHHRIDSRSTSVGWQHDPRSRRGVPYRGAATRARFQPAVGDPRAREAYRGRELQRERAREELAGRLGPPAPRPAGVGAVVPRDRVAAGAGREQAVAAVPRERVAAPVTRERAVAAVNRDNALRGAANPALARAQADRGAASLASMRERAAPRERRQP
jgi:hypothetical protein